MSFRDFVQECYMEPKYWETAEEEGWWKGVLNRITQEEVMQACKNTKLHTAPGESQLSIDLMAHVKGEGIAAITYMFNKFLEDKRIPDAMNTALLRLLPKTDQGLANLDKTRPIALMETLSKLYERVLITRIVSAIDTHKILDMSQYGAVPKAGTAAPLRILAQVMEDARLSQSA